MAVWTQLETHVPMLGSVSKFASDAPGVSTVVLSLAMLGTVVALSSVVAFYRFVVCLFLLPGYSLKRYGAGKGAYAVVTGASDGIGKEFCYALARAGFNIVLISRTKAKLDTLASELEEKYKIKTFAFPLDYTKAKDEHFAMLADTLASMPITVLINNVGVSHEMPVPFVLTSTQEMEAIVNVNVNGTLKTTKALLPAIVDRQSRDHSGDKTLILTMGSFAGMTPTPLLATYAGSKAFLAAWSTALSAELKAYGVDVWFVNSYLVTSAMSKVRKTSFLIPDPKSFVKATLGSLGVYRASPAPAQTVPYYSHALLAWIIQSASNMQSTILDINLQMHESIRQRALAKLARQDKQK